MMKWVYGLFSMCGIALITAGALSMGNKAVAVIGGADGPTSIFIAARPDPVTSTLMLLSGIIILGVIIIVVKKRK